MAEGILLEGSVTKVLHNCMHKVASSRVPAKVSRSNLGCAQNICTQTNINTNTYTQVSREQEEKGIKGEEMKEHLVRTLLLFQHNCHNIWSLLKEKKVNVFFHDMRLTLMICD